MNIKANMTREIAMYTSVHIIQTGGPFSDVSFIGGKVKMQDCE